MIWTARQTKSEFSISFFGDQCKTRTEKAESQKKRNKRKCRMMSWRKNREHKKVLHIDSTETLSTADVPNSAHQHMATPRASPIEGKYSCNVKEPGKSEVIKDGML